MPSVRENLIAARGLIDTPEKWIKGRLQNAEETCFCAYGAAKIARTWPSKRGMDHDLSEALTAALPDAFRADPEGVMPLAQFNDHPTTTHADILSLFDRAIASEDQKNG